MGSVPRLRAALLLWCAGLVGLAGGVSSSAQEPTQEQLAAFRAAQSARVVVEEDYGEAAGASLPLETLGRRLLSYSGLTVVDAASAVSDLTLKITADGMSKKARYRYGMETVWLYTGASLHGTIALESRGLPAYELPFAGKVEPPERLQFREGQTAAEAPFRAASLGDGSFEDVLLRLVLQLYGSKPLAQELLYQLPRQERSSIEERAQDRRKRRILSLLKGLEDRSSGFDVLTAGLQNSDPGVRRAAVHALISLGDPRAVEPLLGVARDPDTDVRMLVLSALGTFGDLRALPVLLQALKSSDPELRSVAAEGLGGIRDPAAVEALLLAMKDRDLGVRSYAATSLGLQGDPRAVQPLLAALKNPDEQVHESAAWGLGRLGAPALEPITRLLKNPAVEMRLRALQALKECNDPGAVELLIAALEDSSSDVSTDAAFYLGEKRAARAVEPLLLALEKGLDAAGPALKKITQKDFGQDAVRWRQWWEENKATFGKSEQPGKP